MWHRRELWCAGSAFGLSMRIKQKHPRRAVPQPLMPDTPTERASRRGAKRSSRKPPRTREVTTRHESRRRHSGRQMKPVDAPSNFGTEKKNSAIRTSPRVPVLQKSLENPDATNMQKKPIPTKSSSRKSIQMEQRTSIVPAKNARPVQHEAVAAQMDKSIMPPATSTQGKTLAQRRSRSSVMSRLGKRGTTDDGPKVDRGRKRYLPDDSSRDSREGTTRRTHSKHGGGRKTEDLSPWMSPKQSKESDRAQTESKSEITRLREEVAQLNREMEKKKVMITKLEQDGAILRSSLADRDATLTEFKTNPAKLFVDVPNFPEPDQLELLDESRRATETMRPAQFWVELEGLIIRFNAFREKVRTAVSMREELGERVRMLGPEFDGSRLDISTMEKEAIHDELEIAKSLGKLYAAKINGDALAQLKASKIVLKVVESFRGVPQIHNFGTKLLAAWEEEQQKYSEEHDRKMQQAQVKPAQDRNAENDVAESKSSESEREQEQGQKKVDDEEDGSEAGAEIPMR